MTNLFERSDVQQYSYIPSIFYWKKKSAVSLYQVRSLICINTQTLLQAYKGSQNHLAKKTRYASSFHKMVQELTSTLFVNTINIYDSRKRVNCN